MSLISKMSPAERTAALAAALDATDMRSRVAEFSRAIAKLRDQFSSVAEALAPAIQGLARVIQNLPEELRNAWTLAAQNGWYPNSLSPLFGTELASDAARLNLFMTQQIQHHWADLTQELVDSHPERSHILRASFELHCEGRYIASIPLFFSQADGIVAENVGAHLFSEHESRSERLAQLIAEGDPFTSILYKVLGVETQFAAGISKSAAAKKALAPNRNGILHGSKRHLDYGTEINSLKAFSLLAFVSFAFRSRSDA